MPMPISVDHLVYSSLRFIMKSKPDITLFASVDIGFELFSL